MEDRWIFAIVFSAAGAVLLGLGLLIGFAIWADEREGGMTESEAIAAARTMGCVPPDAPVLLAKRLKESELSAMLDQGEGSKTTDVWAIVFDQVPIRNCSTGGPAGSPELPDVKLTALVTVYPGVAASQLNMPAPLELRLGLHVPAISREAAVDRAKAELRPLRTELQYAYVTLMSDFQCQLGEPQTDRRPVVAAAVTGDVADGPDEPQIGADRQRGAVVLFDYKTGEELRTVSPIPQGSFACNP